MQSVYTGAAQYSFSSKGSLAYVPGSFKSDQRTLVWVDRNGTERPLPAPARAYRNPRVSPDGLSVVLGVVEHAGAALIYDLARGTLTLLPYEGGPPSTPVWTPDGTRVVYQAGSPPNLFWQRADGSGKEEQLASGEYLQAPNSFTPDQQVLAFIEVNPSSGYDVWVLRLSDRKAFPLIRTPFNETAPVFSPDGRWLAYSSDESGQWEIYVQPYPGPGRKWLISADGGMEPVWNRNGRELFYRNGSKMMAVEMTIQPTFSPGKPRVLFEGPYAPTPATFSNYDVSPDGQRFLMLKTAGEEQAATQINVVLNWFEELKRRVPPGKSR